MALIPYPELDDLTDDLRDYFERFSLEHGRPSLLRLMMAWSPPASRAMDGLYHPIFATGKLDRRLKELLFVAASQERRCFYCMGGHSRFLVTEFGYSPDEVEKLRQGDRVDGMDETELALVHLVRLAASDEASVEPSDIESARSVGWDDDSIVEALATAAQAFFTNTFAQATHLEDDIGDDDYF